MASKKSTRKKSKKTARAKKPARGKKPIRKKKPVQKARRVAARATVRRKLDRQKAVPPDTTLGEWHDDAGEETRQKTLFEDDIPPDYGGSK